MSEASTRSWICSSSYTTSKISSTCVPHMTPVLTLFQHSSRLPPWLNTSSRSSAYSSKHMSEASTGAGFAAAATQRRRSPVHVYHTWCRLQSTAPATKIQPYDSEVVALPRENNLKVTKYCTCHKNPTLRSLWLKNTRKNANHKVGNAHQVLRLPRKVTLELHQVVHLPRKVTLARNNRCHDPTAANTAPVTQKDSHLSPHHIWNVIYSARSNRCHDPTSPNTAPVTQKASHT